MSLAGRHVVVTRPAGQAAHFATALTEAGAIPVLYPVLEIRDIEDTGPVLDVAIRLDSFDLAVFVSPNAIEKALALILPRREKGFIFKTSVLGQFIRISIINAYFVGKSNSEPRPGIEPGTLHLPSARSTN